MRDQEPQDENVGNKKNVIQKETNITPKEKARDIYNTCLLFINANSSFELVMAGKGCAALCVNEIIMEFRRFYDHAGENYEASEHYKWWMEVQNEIQNIPSFPR